MTKRTPEKGYRSERLGGHRLSGLRIGYDETTEKTLVKKHSVALNILPDYQTRENQAILGAFWTLVIEQKYSVL